LYSFYKSSIYVNIRDTKSSDSMAQSPSSNGSSFLSNSSISSNLSQINQATGPHSALNLGSEAGSASNTMMMMMMMPLLTNSTAHKTQSPNASLASTSTIVPAAAAAAAAAASPSASVSAFHDQPIGMSTKSINSPPNSKFLISQKHPHQQSNYSLKLKTTYESEDDQSSSLEERDEFHRHANDAIIINRQDIRDDVEFYFKPTGTMTRNRNNNNVPAASTTTDVRIDDKMKGLSLKNEANARHTSESGPASMDLVLRDQTLKLIQSISTFIRFLNGQNSRMLDYQLKEIVSTLKDLIELIENIEVNSSSKRIAQQISDLETSLSLMISEFKSSNVENVINAALGLARTANELFLTITSASGHTEA
jgi:hypothetical protein